MYLKNGIRNRQVYESSEKGLTGNIKCFRYYWGRSCQKSKTRWFSIFPTETSERERERDTHRCFFRFLLDRSNLTFAAMWKVTETSWIKRFLSLSDKPSPSIVVSPLTTIIFFSLSGWFSASIRNGSCWKKRIKDYFLIYFPSKKKINK